MCYTNKREFYNYLRVSYAMSVPDEQATVRTVTLLAMSYHGGILKTK